MTLWTRVAGAAALLLAATGCTAAETSGSAGPEETAAGGGGAALTAVDGLTVKGRAPMTGYDRDKFGSPWADTDSNGCDTRVISMVHRAAEAFIQLTQGVVGCAH